MESLWVPKSVLIIVSAVLNKFRQQSTVIFQFAPFKQPNTFIRNLKDHGTTAPASLIFRHFPSTEYHIVSIIHLAAWLQGCFSFFSSTNKLPNVKVRNKHSDVSAMSIESGFRVLKNHYHLKRPPFQGLKANEFQVIYKLTAIDYYKYFSGWDALWSAWEPAAKTLFCRIFQKGLRLDKTEKFQARR